MQQKFYKVMAVLPLMYCCETWVLMQKKMSEGKLK